MTVHTIQKFDVSIYHVFEEPCSPMVEGIAQDI